MTTRGSAEKAEMRARQEVVIGQKDNENDRCDKRLTTTPLGITSAFVWPPLSGP